MVQHVPVLKLAWFKGIIPVVNNICFITRIIFVMPVLN